MVQGPSKFGDKKLAVITGTSSGLGKMTARALLRTGEWHVVGAVRDLDKMELVAEMEEFNEEVSREGLWIAMCLCQWVGTRIYTCFEGNTSVESIVYVVSLFLSSALSTLFVSCSCAFFIDINMLILMLPILVDANLSNVCTPSHSPTPMQQTGLHGNGVRLGVLRFGQAVLPRFGQVPRRAPIGPLGLQRRGLPAELGRAQMDARRPRATAADQLPVALPADQQGPAFHGGVRELAPGDSGGVRHRQRQHRGWGWGVPHCGLEEPGRHGPGRQAANFNDGRLQLQRREGGCWFV